MHPLITAHYAEIESICQNNQITSLGLFGSYARGDETQESDIDLLAELPKNLSFLDVVGIEQQFEAVFQKKVDLVEQQTLRKNLSGKILSDLQKIYSS